MGRPDSCEEPCVNAFSRRLRGLALELPEAGPKHKAQSDRPKRALHKRCADAALLKSTATTATHDISHRFATAAAQHIA
jgi:hypothetical protein